MATALDGAARCRRSRHGHALRMVEPSVPVCWICGTPLRLKITHNRNGKAALTLWCGEDGRQLRCPLQSPARHRGDRRPAGGAGQHGGASYGGGGGRCGARGHPECLHNADRREVAQDQPAGGMTVAMVVLAVVILVAAWFTVPPGLWRW